MELQIVAVRDIKTNIYLPPMYFHHKGQAIRAFEDQCRDKSNELGKHPEDYELWWLGVWEDHHGRFEIEHDGGTTTPNQLAAGSNYKE